MIRVRYAPSPTGYLHVGGVRTFLQNYLYARKTGGKMVVRVDDTDQNRSKPEYEKLVLDAIRDLGLTYDEGPEPGGEFPPYRQSERFDIYAEHTRKLLDDGKVFFCFCTEDEITQKREAALKMGRTPIYDGTCRHIPREEAEKRIANGERAGLRFKAPNTDYVIEDQVRGNVKVSGATVGDFMITRTPGEGEREVASGFGFPVYNYACVIDDNLMGITHVIRGEDHLSNTVKQMMIYEAFGWKIPVYAHSAMVLGTDRTKLSKRNGDVSSHDYLEKGYMPEAILNFLALLGWWPPGTLKPQSGHPEILSMDEMVENFGFEGLQKSPAVFDVEKLKWMNSFYMKHEPLEKIVERARPFFDRANMDLSTHGEAWFSRVIDAIRQEVQLLSELPEAAEIFFRYPEEIEAGGTDVLKDAKGPEVVSLLEKGISDCGDSIETDHVGPILNGIKKELGVKGKGLFMPVRVAITGKVHGPDLKSIISILGKEEVLKRIDETKRRAAL